MTKSPGRNSLGRLDPGSLVLAVVDVQGKLAQLMWNREQLFRNLNILIRGARLLEIPLIWMEHVPAKLGRTAPEIVEALDGLEPLAKNTFSCFDCPPFTHRLEALDRRTLLVAGIESHVCVYQTALDGIQAGYRVEVAADAVSSRTPENREAGIRRMESAGAGLTSVEMILFELQRVAEGEVFRTISALVR